VTGQGIITSIDGNKARVRVASPAECAGCSSHGHCSAVESGVREIVAINEYGAQVSDHVEFESDSGKVIVSALLIWIVPILSMIVGYEAAKRFSTGFLPIAVAFLFLGLTFAALKFIDERISGGRTFYPRINRVLRYSQNEPDTCTDARPCISTSREIRD